MYWSMVDSWEQNLEIGWRTLAAAHIAHVV